MCGILGVYGREIDIENFKSALDLISHRGPDDDGIISRSNLIFGHRRLSIVDLSPTGHQPMIDPVTGSIIVYNGEIYNHIEIRNKLIKIGYKFRGTSDTEVLLYALIEWDIEALKHLNGMWSFAFWSPTSGNLLISRDRFGVKPLYYINNKNYFAFSSEPKALLKLFPDYRKLNEEALLNFLGNNLLYANGKSFYDGIEVLPPAHYAIVSNGHSRFISKKYWNYPLNENIHIKEEHAIDEFEELFDNSVQLRLRSDVKIGVTLSGGLDSTAVLTAAAKYGGQINSFTSIYDDKSISEVEWAKIAANKSNSILTSVSSPDKNWFDTLKKISWHMDAPGYSPAVYPLWNLMKKSRENGVLVLLEGQGADEAFAGYPQYWALNLINTIKESGIGSIYNYPEVYKKIIGMHAAFGTTASIAWLIREVMPIVHRFYRNRFGLQSLMKPGINIPTINNENSIDLSPAKIRLMQDHSINILPGLLHYGDSISMAHGIESRNPFLDYKLVEWSFKIPPHLLFKNGQTKWIIREYLKRNSQNEIATRMDKKGYPTAIKKWTTNKENYDIESYMTSNSNPVLQWCEKRKIKKLFVKSRNNVPGADFHIYKLLSTQMWMEECLK